MAVPLHKDQYFLLENPLNWSELSVMKISCRVLGSIKAGSFTLTGQLRDFPKNWQNVPALRLLTGDVAEF